MLDAFPLLLTVALLGVRHGLDADHLATIDGLTRFNSGRRIGPWCGSLFSLGHGAVVTAVAVWSSSLSSRWNIPLWMEDSGVWISILSLTALGLLNLHAAVSCRPGQTVQPVGFKGRFFGRLQFTQNPWLIGLIGALFALSFDTLTLVAMFSFAAHETRHGEMAFVLGLAFTFGMLIADGINGFWISRLLRRTDQLALIASRVMGAAIGMLSLLIAGWGLGKHLSPSLQAWGDGKELVLGVSVVAAIAASFFGAVWLAHVRMPRSGA